MVTALPEQLEAKDAELREANTLVACFEHGRGRGRRDEHDARIHPFKWRKLMHFTHHNSRIRRNNFRNSWQILANATV